MPSTTAHGTASGSPLAPDRFLELLAMVTNGTDVIVALQDTEFRYTYFNERYREEIRRLTGRELALGDCMLDVFALLPEQRAVARDEWARTLRGEPSSRTIEFGDPGRYQRTYQVLHTPIRDASGKVAGAAEVAHDVTERVRAEAEVGRLNQDLRRRLAELQTILDTVPIGVAIARDPDGSHIQGNQAIEQMLGVGRGDELSKASSRAARYRCLHQGRDLAVTELPMQRAVRGETVTGQIYDVVREDGSRFTLHASASPLYDEAGQPRGAVGAFLDITDQRQAQARTRLLSDVASRLLAVDNPQKVVESLCRDVMEFVDCDVFFNYLVDDPTSRLRLNACGGVPDHAAAAIEWLDFGAAVCGCVARDGCRIVAEHILTSSDPRSALVRSLGIQAYACHPLLDGGRVIGTLSFGTRTRPTFTPDELSLLKTVTDHVALAMQRVRLFESLERRVVERTAEAENRAAQLRVLALELTQTEERERRRLAQVLHDHLQQILVAAKMHANLARARTNDEGLAESLGQISSLLDQSLAESRSLTVELSPPVLYARGLGGGLEWLARHFHERHHLQVRLEVGPDTEPPDETTRVVLFQAAREMLFNTVKHASARSAWLGLTRPSEARLLLVVEDDGRGLDPATVRAGSSAGFGLISIRERVAILGGTLATTRSTHGGARVAVEIPCGVAEARPPSAPVESLPDPSVENHPSCPAEPSVRLRILLVDDHEVVRQGLAGLLQGQPGIELVGEASNGREAVDLARQLRPDVILMDVTMPGVDGVEATRRITAELPGSCVIGLSMHDSETMATAMLEAGAAAYLTKSEATDTLVSTILSHAPGRASPR